MKELFVRDGIKNKMFDQVNSLEIKDQNINSIFSINNEALGFIRRTND